MMSVKGEVGSMQEAALKRREKLQSMKERQNKGQADQTDNTTTEVEKLPKPVFRSYTPQDEGLKDSQLPRTKPLEVKEMMKDAIEDAKSEQIVEEVDLGNLAPRKPDWDLKRDIAKKLERLERRTQRAIADLIRERLQAGEEDLATAVSAGPTAEDSSAAAAHTAISSLTSAATEADNDYYMDDEDDL